jgi:hypothetical protein
MLRFSRTQILGSFLLLAALLTLLLVRYLHLL